MDLIKLYNFQENFELAYKNYFAGLCSLRCFTTFDNEELPENYLAVEFQLGGANGSESTTSIPVTGEVEEDTFNSTLNIMLFTRRGDDSNLAWHSEVIKYHALVRSSIMVKMLRGNLEHVNIPDYYTIAELSLQGSSVSIEEGNYEDVTMLQYRITFKITRWEDEEEEPPQSPVIPEIGIE